VPLNQVLKQRGYEATAAALMFSSSLAPMPALANDGQPVKVPATAVHPIMQTQAYVGRLSEQMKKDNVARHALVARGFAQELEARLSKPSDKPQFLGTPNPAANGQVVVSAVIPPQGMYQTASIPVYVEGPVKDAAGNIQSTSQVIATYMITTQGEVVPYKFNGQITTATQGFAFACRAPMMAARAEMQ
jgi:hypothetical protein